MITQRGLIPSRADHGFHRASLRRIGDPGADAQAVAEARASAAAEARASTATRRPASAAAEAQASPASSKEMRRPASMVMEAWASIATEGRQAASEARASSATRRLASAASGELDRRAVRRPWQAVSAMARLRRFRRTLWRAWLPPPASASAEAPARAEVGKQVCKLQRR